jgi:uncharacterized membrane protein YjfL (UPF0719 family)
MENLLSDVRIPQVVSTVIYSFLGVGIFGLAYAIIEKFCPFSVKKEISQDHNVALGIIIGAVMIGLALIISAAISTE